MGESVLILKNIASEGAGTIGDFLGENSVPCTIVELEKGETPPPLDDFGTLVIMGGPMGAYEMHIYPFLSTCAATIKEAIDRDMRVLGVCLGAQMIAHVLGAKVYKGGRQEIGWRDIELTGEGLKDPLMWALSRHPKVGDIWRRFKVFHWHGDTFPTPPGAVHLAKSDMYESQAFRYGDRVYGLQFHIEITGDILHGWLGRDAIWPEVKKETDRFLGDCTGRAMNFYKAFFSTKKTPKEVSGRR